MKYAQLKNVTWKHKDKISDSIAYYGNFLIFKVSWFLSNREVLDYLDFIDNTGGIYRYRWAEQTILPIALAMFLDYNQIYWISSKYLTLNHYNVAYYPAPKKRCPNVSAEPDCCDWGTAVLFLTEFCKKNFRFFAFESNVGENWEAKC